MTAAEKSFYDQYRRIIPALAISAIGALFYNILPLYVGAAQDGLGLSDSTVGLLPAAFFLGYNVITLSAFFWIRHWNWRHASLVWLPLGLCGLLLSLKTNSTLALFGGTVLAGGGFAALYGIGTTILADTSNPARWYGVKIATEAMPGAILLLVLPSTWVAEFGFSGVVYGLLAATLLLAMFLPTLPGSGAPEDSRHSPVSNDDAITTNNKLPIWMALIGTLLFFSAASGLWAFIERMGAELSFDAEAIGILLAMTLVFATLGSLTTAWIGKRFGNVGPIMLSSAMLFTATLILYGTPSFPLYSLGTTLLTFGIGMGLPFAVAEIAELDFDGRFIILSVPAIGLGAMIGPASAGYLIESVSFNGVLLTAGPTVILAAVFLKSGRVLAARNL